MEEKRQKIALIIGAGAAGIAAAYKLAIESDIKPILIEKESVIGGLAKTLNFDGQKADIGPHRFFTKNKSVMDLWKGVLPLQGKPAKDDILLNRNNDFSGGVANPENDNKVFLKRKRFSRIYYMKKFFDYPVKMNLKTILNMGIIKTMFAGFSYIKSCIIKKQEKNLEDFMINRFGKVLYEMFFEFYTQKVWGRHPQNISKKWGEQRIKGLSLLKTIINKFTANKETSLIEEYYYPKFGAGEMWDEMAKTVVEKGGEIHLNAEVNGLKLENNKITSVTVTDENGTYEWWGDYIISSMPVKDLIRGINNCPSDILDIADGLPYRDYQLICFKVDKFNLKNNTPRKTINNICPDSWIYIQDREVNAGRIYIPKNFSPYLSENLYDIFICMEYFCSVGDSLWDMSDEEIFEYGKNELIKINAIKSDCVIEKSYRYRAEKAYPAYFDTYKDFDKIKDFVNSIDNLYLIGRNGQHKYNNMDHSTLSGMVSAEIILKNTDKSKLWNVNTEQSYQEAVK